MSLHFFITALLLTTNVQAQAAELIIKRKSIAGRTIETTTLMGPIIAGDTRRLADFWIRNPNTTNPTLFISSNGGDLQEAMALGELVSELRLSTQVESEGGCYSACFFVWLNGTNRFAAPMERTIRNLGKVGLHRPYLVRPTNDNASLLKQSKVMNTVSTYLRARNVPSRLAEIMMSRSSQDIYLLREEDLTELGVVSPPLEELQLAQCGVNLNRLGQAMDRYASQSAYEDAKAAYISAIDCTILLDITARTATLAKIKAGWLPRRPELN